MREERHPLHSHPKNGVIELNCYLLIRKHSLKEWQPPESILSKQYDLAVVASFGYFIPPHVIQCFKDGGINMHPSLLPKYRGPAPIHHALLNVKFLNWFLIFREIRKQAFQSSL